MKLLKFFLLVTFFSGCYAALSDSESDENAHDEFRMELEQAFAANEISSTRMKRFVQKAKKCKVKTLSRLAKAAKSSKKNLKRNLMRSIVGKKMWVPLFWAKVPLADGKEHLMPFMLPHIILHKLAQDSSSLDPLKPQVNDAAYARIQAVAKELQDNPADFISVGLHCDGTPLGRSDRDSMEVFSINFPSWRDQHMLRIPVAIINKKHIDKMKTIPRILEILAWSFKCLAVGEVYDFEGIGGTKAVPIGTKLPKALLTQLRADWACLKQVFGLPQQNENAGICHLCKATPDTMQEVGADAVWRSQRYEANEFHKMQQDRGIKPCPLWSVPGIDVSIIHLDWLHACDLGIGADICGNIFKAVMPFLEGSNQEKRIQSLWREIKQWYSANMVESKIDKLCASHFLKEKKSPKLSAKAASIRQLIPFLQYITEKLFQNTDDRVTEYHRTVLHLARSLNEAYALLHDWDAEKMARSCRRTCLLLRSLRDHAVSKKPDSLDWKMKPKVHIFQELCEYVAPIKGNPKDYWYYKDEDFGGYLQKLGSRLGGPNTAKSIAVNVFQKFCILNRMPIAV